MSTDKSKKRGLLSSCSAPLSAAKKTLTLSSSLFFIPLVNNVVITKEKLTLLQFYKSLILTERKKIHANIHTAKKY